MGEGAERDARLALTAAFARSRMTLSARGAAWRLAALAVASTVIRVALGRTVHGPFIFLDELGYQRMALSLARTGHLALLGKSGLSYSPLYSVVLAPIYSVAHSAAGGYESTKVLNAALMSAAVFPVYGIARAVLPRRSSLGVAALSLLLPLLFYSSVGLSENLAYPLFALAVWALLRTLRDPSLRNDALLAVTTVLAMAARLQQVALVPAAISAIMFVALLSPAPTRESAVRALGRAVLRHRLYFGCVVVAGIAVVARTISNGGTLPLAGRYSDVTGSHASWQRVAQETIQHVAGLDLAVGVLPFMGALVAAIALVRYGLPERGLIFGSVAFAITAWLVVEVALDAAETDSTSRSIHPSGTGLLPDLPRIHERYLIYLMPFFLVALVAALRVPRGKVGPRAYVLAGVVTALLPAAIPFGQDMNSTVVSDSFGLNLFTKGINGQAVPIANAALVAVILAGALVLVYLYAVFDDNRPLVILVLVGVLFAMSALVESRMRFAASSATTPALPAHRDWVDRVVHGSRVVLVGGPRKQGDALRETAFNNLSIARVYYTCAEAFGPEFGEQQATLGEDRTLRDAAGDLRARYAVVPAKFDLRGRVLARDPKGGLVLVAPLGEKLTVPARARSVFRCER